MDWLMVFVIISIVGQFALIVYFQNKRDRETKELIARAKAQLLEQMAADQDLSVALESEKINAKDK